MSQNIMLSPAFPASKKVYLQPVRISGVEIDICPKTGGLWFDRFEITKFDEAHESLDELLKMIPENPVVPEVQSGRKSPRHPEATMQQEPYGPKGANGVLTIDKCPVCAGIWLDFKEIQKIRELYPKASDKQKAVEDFVNNAFRDFPRSPQAKGQPGVVGSLISKLIK